MATYKGPVTKSKSTYDLYQTKMSQMNSLKQNYLQVQLKMSNFESQLKLKSVTKDVAEHDIGLKYCSNLCDDFITEESDVSTSVAK